MTRHQIEDKLHPPLVGLLRQNHQIRIGTEPGIHLIEIDDIVTAIRPARHIDRIQPDRRDPQGLDIIQAGRNARQIADTVAITVLERRRINLIEHRIAQPRRLGRILGPQAAQGNQGGRNQRNESVKLHSKENYLTAISCTGFSGRQTLFTGQD